MPEKQKETGPTRRALLEGGAATTMLLVAGLPVGRFAVAAVAAEPTVTPMPTLPVKLNINARNIAVEVDPRTTLLDTLRNHLGLTGSKKGCDHGQCGACTVLVNGRRINACLSLAAMHEGDEITTIEGLAAEGETSPGSGGFHRT